MQVFTSHKIGESAKHLDYIIEKTERAVTISTTENEYLAGILDSEDDITIEIAGQELVLDYSEAEQLLALLLAHYDGKMNIVETKTIRSV